MMWRPLIATSRLHSAPCSPCHPLITLISYIIALGGLTGCCLADGRPGLLLPMSVADPAGSRCGFKGALPRHYVAHRVTGEPPVIDGHIDEQAWREVGWTEPFTDIFDRPPPRFETRAKIRWDPEWLYIAAQLTEPQIWGNISRHNEVIYHDNDFEVFVDADGSSHYYKEFEINANAATWDLCINKPYLDNGYENSTRVFGRSGWEMQPPLRAAVGLQGSDCKVGDPRQHCTAWTVELAMPLASLAFNTTAELPPRPGESFWRINFSRVEWHVEARDGRFVKQPVLGDPDNWVWSPQGAINMHLPERWGILQFASGPVNATRPLPYPHWTLRHVAMSLYGAQRAFHDASGAYTAELRELLPLSPPGSLDGGCTGEVRVSVSKDGQSYSAEVPAVGGGTSACISDSRLLTIRPTGSCGGGIAATGEDRPPAISTA